MSMESKNANSAAQDKGLVSRILTATEIDTRMLGMVAALIAIWVAFDIYSGILRPGTRLFGGSFLTPRNLWTLLVQTSSIAVMTTGMVLIIVMRHIDLSVGSMLSLVAVAGAVLQVFILAPAIGVGQLLFQPNLCMESDRRLRPGCGFRRSAANGIGRRLLKSRIEVLLRRCNGLSTLRSTI